MKQIVLASSSPYKQRLLQRLGIPFVVDAANVDETTNTKLSPEQTARFLSLKKANHIAPKYPNSVIIGADQVADLNGSPINKPYTYEQAVAQLLEQSGKSVYFHTALTVLCTDSTGAMTKYTGVTSTEVHFRELSIAQIDAYLNHEKPYDCAGSFKSEGLGIRLFHRIDSADPTALIGLPLIDLCSQLLYVGIKIPHN
ncbi:MAG: Maf family nucleotide pyrophosphatase [Porticoccaceae bacterium]|nr:Maf family nucleotide pyrophosphatase [Porticoccaceae bacterium]MDG1474396.1 Maf family nucleotide pyrophosphatase [Porticoccaceae bacterium]